MAARGHFVFPIDAKNHKVLVIWDLNGYGEYEFDWCICEKVMAYTSVGVYNIVAIYGSVYTLVTKRKVYFGLLADIAVFLLQPKLYAAWKYSGINSAFIEPTNRHI